MNKITRLGLAAGAAKRWEQRYGPKWESYGGMDKKAIHRALVLLGDNPSVVDVNKAIGNTSWTATRCDDCEGTDFDEIMEVGQEPDYDSQTARMCKACLQSALREMDKS